MEDLKTMTAEQLLDSEDFLKALQVKIDAEKDHHDRMMRVAFTKKLRLQRNPINRLMERGVFNANDIKDIYKLILVKQLQGFSSTEREYVKVLGNIVYGELVDRYKREQQVKQE